MAPDAQGPWVQGVSCCCVRVRKRCNQPWACAANDGVSTARARIWSFPRPDYCPRLTPLLPFPQGLHRKVRMSMDWRHRARCRDVDPELFFPVGPPGPAEAQGPSGKAFCALWPVREECLQWSLDTAQDAGVWGGLSEEERRALRRGQARRVGIALGASPGVARLRRNDQDEQIVR